MEPFEKLAAIRAGMKKKNLAALVVTSSDPHQGEYVAPHWQARAWLTGFTGSAGIAVVTMDRALLWTDFRYWIQARSQMSGVELIKQGEEGVPGFDAWLCDHLEPGQTVGLDGRTISVSEAKRLEERFKDRGLGLDTRADLVSPVWEDRPPMPATKGFLFPDAYAGQSRGEKLSLIREKMAEFRVASLFMATLDDIAWTFNLRGGDVHTNPVSLAYALITQDQARLFMAEGKLMAEDAAILASEGICLEPYDRIDAALGAVAPGTRVCLDPDRTSIHLRLALNPEAVIVEKPNPAVALKAVKNRTEIGWLEKTAVKDGQAVVRFLHWLETSGAPVTEISAAEKMHDLRKGQQGFINDSFDAIMASGDHSAMCHYRAIQETDKAITDQGMFLADSGGNYLTGTTDITRTLHLGAPGDQEKQDYTLVLKGHIAVAMARFPAGTRGYQIDTLARQFLWQQGMDFGHGTGHGVGFFLCVHEGPARISPHPVDQALRPGMLLTNEPGLYREGAYGIRLENMVVVAEDQETPFGKFLRFRNLTLCHFERKLMVKEMMTAKEIAWVDDYHDQVYKALAPGLPPDVGAWLRQKTLPL